MVIDSQVAQLVGRLSADADFLAKVRLDPGEIITERYLSAAIQRTIVSNRASDLRTLIGLDDEGTVFLDAYTSGGQCSTACSQAGCYTEGKCPSNYACSKTGPC